MTKRNDNTNLHIIKQLKNLPVEDFNPTIEKQILKMAQKPIQYKAFWEKFAQETNLKNPYADDFNDLVVAYIIADYFRHYLHKDVYHDDIDVILKVLLKWFGNEIETPSQLEQQLLINYVQRLHKVDVPDILAKIYSYADYETKHHAVSDTLLFIFVNTDTEIRYHLFMQILQQYANILHFDITNNFLGALFSSPEGLKALKEMVDDINTNHFIKDLAKALYNNAVDPNWTVDKLLTSLISNVLTLPDIQKQQWVSYIASAINTLLSNNIIKKRILLTKDLKKRLKAFLETDTRPPAWTLSDDERKELLSIAPQIKDMLLKGHSQNKKR